MRLYGSIHVSAVLFFIIFVALVLFLPLFAIIGLDLAFALMLEVVVALVFVLCWWHPALTKLALPHSLPIRCHLLRKVKAGGIVVMLIVTALPLVVVALTLTLKVALILALTLIVEPMLVLVLVLVLVVANTYLALILGLIFVRAAIIATVIDARARTTVSIRIWRRPSPPCIRLIRVVHVNCHDESNLTQRSRCGISCLAQLAST